MPHQTPVGWASSAKTLSRSTAAIGEVVLVPAVAGQRIVVKSLRITAPSSNVFLDVIQDIGGSKTTIFNDILISQGTPGLNWADDDGILELAPGAALVVKPESAAVTHYSLTYWQHP